MACNTYTLFLKYLAEEGLDLEKVKAASDKTWEALGRESGKQVKALFSNAPIHEAVFASVSIGNEIHGMKFKEEKTESQRCAEIQKCPWHNVAETFNLPKEWRLCVSAHKAFTSTMIDTISPGSTFEMSKNIPSGDAFCEEKVTV